MQSLCHSRKRQELPSYEGEHGVLPQAGGLIAISRWLSAATPPVRSVAVIGHWLLVIGSARDLTRDRLEPRDRTPGDDAEGNNPHRQPAYQSRRFHAASVKRRPLSRHGLLEQGTRLWLGLSPATPFDSTRVIVRPRRLVPPPYNQILQTLRHASESRLPVAGTTLCMCDCNNGYSIGVKSVDDAVWIAFQTT
jgi:hypothetical protein